MSEFPTCNALIIDQLDNLRLMVTNYFGQNYYYPIHHYIKIIITYIIDGIVLFWHQTYRIQRMVLSQAMNSMKMKTTEMTMHRILQQMLMC